MPDPRPLTAARIGELFACSSSWSRPTSHPSMCASTSPTAWPTSTRWRALAPGDEPGPLLDCLGWWPLVEELAERAALAGIVGEADERVGALRRVLLVGEEAP